MACPFFVPTRQADDIAWLHPSRLPLGGGWNGHCGAPGHENSVLASEEIRDHCNLGYATACPRLPQKRECDAVRFSIARDCDSLLTVWFVYESAHRPAGHDLLQYRKDRRAWISIHPNPLIQRMAECYVQSYLARRLSMNDRAAETVRKDA